jgi:hypothetical protein
VIALRAELAGIDPARDCDRDAERAGLEASGRRRDPTLARLAVRLARHDDPQASTASPGGEKARAAAATFDWDGRPEHCRMAWLRGRFLARGSLSLSSGRTHLELVVLPDEAPVIAVRLAEMGSPPSWRVRRGRGVVTLKSAESIQLFLRRIGAGASLLELEARQVARSLRGDLNRVINAESANLARTVLAAGEQLEAIAALEADGRLARLAMHRSAVQRALERIERLARLALA